MAKNNKFLLDISKFIKKPEIAVIAAGKTYIDLASAIIKATPVADYLGGSLRANWIPSTDNPIETITEEKDNSGEPTIQKVIGIASNFNKDGSLFLTNSSKQINVVEFGGYPTVGDGPPSNGPKTTGGFSKQAPQGMVRVNLEYYENNLKKNLQEGGW